MVGVGVYICNSYTMGSRGISINARVTRAFIPIFPVNNHSIIILYPDYF